MDSFPLLASLVTKSDLIISIRAFKSDFTFPAGALFGYVIGSSDKADTYEYVKQGFVGTENGSYVLSGAATIIRSGSIASCVKYEIISVSNRHFTRNGENTIIIFSK